MTGRWDDYLAWREEWVGVGSHKLFTYSPSHERYLSIEIQELAEVCAELGVPLVAVTAGEIQTQWRYRYQLPRSRIQDVIAGHARRHVAEFSDPKYDLIEVADVRRELRIAEDSEWNDVLRTLGRSAHATPARLPRFEVAQIPAVLDTVRENLNERGYQSGSARVQGNLCPSCGMAVEPTSGWCACA